MIDARLITFVDLVKTKNYTKTAQNLFITQPAVSHHIKTLEKDTNVKLFANLKTFKLTDEGQIIYEYAKKCVLMYNQLEVALKKEGTSYHNIKFATTNQLASTVVNQILLKWIKDNPNDKISMNILEKEKMYEAICKGEIDFAIIDFPYDRNQFNGIPLFDLNASIYASTKNHLTNKAKVNMEQLKKETLVTDCANSGIRLMLDNALNKQNSNVNSFEGLLEIHDPVVMKNLIIANSGVGLLYDNFVKDELKKKKIVKLSTMSSANLTQKVTLIYSLESLKEKSNEYIADEIIKMYQKIYA